MDDCADKILPKIKPNKDKTLTSVIWTLELYLA